MTAFSKINSPCAWKREEISSDSDWQISLTETHIKEINNLVSGNSKETPSLTKLLSGAGELLENGPGVVLIRDCPIQDLNEHEAKKLFLSAKPKKNIFLLLLLNRYFFKIYPSFDCKLPLIFFFSIWP